MINALIGHLVGDFLLQNDWMALNKKQSTLHCSVHCLLWTLSVAVFTGWWHPLILLILFVTHFAQDRTTFINRYMKLVGQSQFSQAPMAPWSTIVVDNTFHLVVLWLIQTFVICHL